MKRFLVYEQVLTENPGSGTPGIFCLLFRVAGLAGRTPAAAAGAAGFFLSAHTQQRAGHSGRHNDHHDNIAPVFT